MNRIVQITGLPRSGTAFMAAFSMLYPGANVFHENIADGGDWRGRIIQSVECYRLTIDCGTYQYFPGASRKHSYKIPILRNEDDSTRSAAKASGRDVTDEDYATGYLLRRTFDRWVEEHRQFAIPFESLFDVDMLLTIWDEFNRITGQSHSYPTENNLTQLLRMRIVRKDIEKFSRENVEKNAHELLKPWD